MNTPLHSALLRFFTKANSFQATQHISFPVRIIVKPLHYIA